MIVKMAAIVMVVVMIMRNCVQRIAGCIVNHPAVSWFQFVRQNEHDGAFFVCGSCGAMDVKQRVHFAHEEGGG